ELAKSRPGDKGSKVDLAAAYTRMGNVSAPAKALAYYEEALKLRLELAGPPPWKVAATRDVMVSYNKLTGAHLSLGQPAAGQKYAAESLKLADALVRAAPKINLFKQDFAFSFEQIGKVFLGIGDGVKAKQCFVKALELVQPLAASDPKDLNLQVSL